MIESLENLTKIFLPSVGSSVSAENSGAVESSVSAKNSDVVESSANLANPFQFSSEYYDSELNLVYYNYRHYDPETGRFLSKDPIAEQGGVNLYNFVQNNPINRIDQLGLKIIYNGGLIVDTNPLNYPPGPGLIDQLNPFGLRGNQGNEDYRRWFERRFPKTINGAQKELTLRIKNYIMSNLCKSSIETTFEMSLLGGNDDIDVSKTDMSRFGDKPQNWLESNVFIGKFEIKVKDIMITWKVDKKFNFSAIMYILEQTGVGEGERFGFLEPLFGKRYVNMGEWNINGDGDCCELEK